MNIAVSADQVSFAYPRSDQPALKELDLELKAGECVVFCGLSGSGKTTLTQLLNGLAPKYIQGELLGDIMTLDLDPQINTIEDYVGRVGSVFQNPKNQHFASNSSSELAFPMENMGYEPDVIVDRIREVAAEFELDHLLNLSLFDLSGGEKQQIALATACVLRPLVLVLDEISSNLDQGAIERLQTMLAKAKDQGVTILMTEHRLAWAAELADRYILIEDGQLSQAWTLDEFRALNPEFLHSYGLRTNDLGPVRDLLKDIPEASVSEGAELGTRDLAIGYESSDIVLDHLNLSFAAGEVTGILGPNGIGKSTLANTLVGLQAPLAGQILWQGQVVQTRDLLKQGFLVMQDTNYQLFHESVESEVMFNAKYPQAKDQVLHALNLVDLVDRHPMSLSGGQKQRVAIASALLSGAEVIIFDEPTSGMDYYHMKQFASLLDQLKARGIVIIVISHDEELATECFDRVLYL